MRYNSYSNAFFFHIYIFDRITYIIDLILCLGRDIDTAFQYILLECAFEIN